MATSSNTSLALRGFAVGSTLWIASAMASTSLIFVPALLRPLSSRPPATKTVSDADDRLTPQIEGQGGSTVPSSASYRAVAQQFVQMDVLAFRAQVPLEFLIIAVNGVLAYRSRSAGSRLWTHWAGCAGIVAAVFPFTGALMVPYVHKLARLAGVEEKVEPYEDAPLDREAEKSNTVEFLTKWNGLNGIRTGGLLLAGAIGVRGLILE